MDAVMEEVKLTDAQLDEIGAGLLRGDARVVEQLLAETERQAARDFVTTVRPAMLQNLNGWPTREELAAELSELEDFVLARRPWLSFKVRPDYQWARIRYGILGEANREHIRIEKELKQAIWMLPHNKQRRAVKGREDRAVWLRDQDAINSGARVNALIRAN